MKFRGWVGVLSVHNFVPNEILKLNEIHARKRKALLHDTVDVDEDK